VIRLDAATVLLQWAVGGLFFCWVTTRGRLVGLGYGWLLRGVYALMAAGSLSAAGFIGWVPVRDVASAGVFVASTIAFVSSVQRRKAGLSGQVALKAKRKARVEVMATASLTMRDQFGRVSPETPRAEPVNGPEFWPWLDLVAPAIGLVGLIAAGLDAESSQLLAVVRTVVGAAFLGAVSDAMLLGHWYLVQPGLPRHPIEELNTWLLRIWPAEVALLLVPTGMISALTGAVDDSWGGMLAWFWVACAITTGVLGYVTRAALRERSYSAVMAATGLLYLAILTAFGTDLVARAILSG
jgi:hypothetical protein